MQLTIMLGRLMIMTSLNISYQKKPKEMPEGVTSATNRLDTKKAGAK